MSASQENIIGKGNYISETEVIDSREHDTVMPKQNRKRSELLEIASFFICLESTVNIYGEARFFYRIKTSELLKINI